jgi:hypothetical protein
LVFVIVFVIVNSMIAHLLAVCLLRVVVVAVGVVIADRYVHIYNDRFVCGTVFDVSVVAALVLPVATTCLHYRLSAGRDSDRVGEVETAASSRSSSFVFGSAHYPLPPVPIPVSCMGDVGLLIIASCRRLIVALSRLSRSLFLVGEAVQDAFCKHTTLLLPNWIGAQYSFGHRRGE